MTVPPNSRKVYLGDSVYVVWDGFVLILTTENGYGPTNTIVLEPKVYEALSQFAATLPKSTEGKGP